MENKPKKKEYRRKPSRTQFDKIYPTMKALMWVDRIKYETAFSEWKAKETEKRRAVCKG